MGQPSGRKSVHCCQGVIRLKGEPLVGRGRGNGGIFGKGKSSVSLCRSCSRALDTAPIHLGVGAPRYEPSSSILEASREAGRGGSGGWGTSRCTSSWNSGYSANRSAAERYSRSSARLASSSTSWASCTAIILAASAALSSASFVRPMRVCAHARWSCSRSRCLFRSSSNRHQPCIRQFRSACSVINDLGVVLLTQVGFLSAPQRYTAINN